MQVTRLQGIVASILVAPLFLAMAAWEWIRWVLRLGPKPEPEDFS